MMVNGPLEIYSTVMGVKMFDSMFNILASTGIIFLPLLTLLFQNVTTPYESEIENGAATSLKRVGIHFLMWVFTVMLFVAPTHKLDITAISYKPVCMPNATKSTFGDTGTTYDDAFSNLHYESLSLPIMMYLVLGGMSGFTNAMITSLPCKTDVQEIKSTIDTTRLTPQVATQVQRFQNECFATAKAMFDSKDPDPSTYEATMDSYGGQTDLSWIGSHVMQTLYYNNLYPSAPVSGFSYDEYPGQYAAFNEKHGVPKTKWGYPTCQEWWSDPDHGLQHQLVLLAEQHSPNNPHLGQESLGTRVDSWLASAKRFVHLGSQVTSDDVISRDMLYDVGANSGFGRNYTGWMSYSNEEDGPLSGGSDMVWSGVKNTFAGVGQGVSAAFGAIDREEIAQEIPILQAVLLSFALMLGPLIICFGMITGRGISVIFTYYFLVGSLFFMTFIERFIHYLETSLHASQSAGVYAMGDSPVMYNLFTKLYFYGPMLYLALMSIAGIGIGNSLSSAFENNSAGSGQAFARNLIKFIPK